MDKTAACENGHTKINSLPAGIRLIALDIDGTILNSKSRLTPRVAAAIENASRAGITVLPATGRQLSSIPEEVLGLHGFRYVIATNGAKLYDLDEGTVLLRDCFCRQAALPILDACMRSGALVGVYMEGSGYAQKHSLEPFIDFLPPTFIEYFRNTRIEVDNLRDFIAQSSGDIEKFTLHFADAALRQEALVEFEKRGDLSVTFSAHSNLEFGTPTASKGAALTALASHLGYEKGRVMAIGNSHNDMSMLRAAGYAVAMGNSPGELRELADTIAPTNNEDGVAVILESLAT